MAAVGRVYNHAFDRSPAGTLAVTNGVLSAVADIVAQGTQMGVSIRRVPSAVMSIAPACDTQLSQAIFSMTDTFERSLRIVTFRKNRGRHR